MLNKTARILLFILIVAGYGLVMAVAMYKDQRLGLLATHTCNLYTDVAILILELNELNRSDMEMAEALLETGPLYAGTIELNEIRKLCEGRDDNFDRK